MDTTILQCRDCRILCALRYPAIAVDAAHLHSISLLFLEKRGKKRICGSISHTQSQVGHNTDYENGTHACFDRDCVAEYGCTSPYTLSLAENLRRDLKFGYNNRAIWSGGFVTIGLGWPLTSWPKGRWKLFGPWATSCLLTAVFPLLRVDPSESLGTM